MSALCDCTGETHSASCLTARLTHIRSQIFVCDVGRAGGGVRVCHRDQKLLETTAFMRSSSNEGEISHGVCLELRGGAGGCSSMNLWETTC